MNISVTIEQGNTAVNIIADENRKIKDVCEELHREGYIPSGAGSFMRLSAEERVISSENSFRDEGIYSGDKISEI